MNGLEILGIFFGILGISCLVAGGIIGYTSEECNIPMPCYDKYGSEIFGAECIGCAPTPDIAIYLAFGGALIVLLGGAIYTTSMLGGMGI